MVQAGSCFVPTSAHKIAASAYSRSSIVIAPYIVLSSIHLQTGRPGGRSPETGQNFAKEAIFFKFMQQKYYLLDGA